MTSRHPYNICNHNTMHGVARSKYDYVIHLFCVSFFIYPLCFDVNNSIKPIPSTPSTTLDQFLMTDIEYLYFSF